MHNRELQKEVGRLQSVVSENLRKISVCRILQNRMFILRDFNYTHTHTKHIWVSSAKRSNCKRLEMMARQ